MKKITIIWTITLILIVAGLTVLGFKIKKENIDNIMEDALVEQAEKYLGLYPGLFPTLGNNIKLTAEELKDNGYDAGLSNENCEGYIIVENTNSGFKYHPYVKCSDYMTEGYSEE